MNIEEAVELLSYHCGSSQDIENPKWENGFLGMLRPYQGHLIENNYHEVMACIRTLGPELQTGDTLPGKPINSIWAICHLARSWGVDPNGMLRRNKLISDKDIETLENWIDTISWATMMLIDGCDHEVAFEIYQSPVR